MKGLWRIRIVGTEQRGKFFCSLWVAWKELYNSACGLKGHRKIYNLRRMQNMSRASNVCLLQLLEGLICKMHLVGGHTLCHLSSSTFLFHPLPTLLTKCIMLHSMTCIWGQKQVRGLGRLAMRRVRSTEECLLGSNAAVGHDKMGNQRRWLQLFLFGLLSQVQ